MASFAPSSVYGFALDTVRAGDLIAIDGSDAGCFYVPAGAAIESVEPRAPIDCHHCGAPPDPAHPIACRFCGTTRRHR